MEDATAGLIETEQARELLEAVNEQLGSESIQFYPGSGHRHLMVWVGGKSRAMCLDPQPLVGRSIADALPSGDGADVLRKIMDAAFFILRDHPVNEEREQEGLKPANCLWLWGQGRAAVWPPLPERYQIAGVVVSSSDVHRGVGVCAGWMRSSFRLPTETMRMSSRAVCKRRRRNWRRGFRLSARRTFRRRAAHD
jgi:2,3-bisphosphoglycerate-independent phosphoglycerate mutase